MHTIMIVDDMPMARELVAEALGRHGYEVVCASNGIEALEMLRARVPDAILLDVMMPGLDGISVLRTIRRNPQLKDIPVILLTERAERDMVLQAVERGASGYILKSEFSVEKLLGRIEQCLAEPSGRHVGLRRTDPVHTSTSAETRPFSSKHYKAWREAVEEPRHGGEVAARASLVNESRVRGQCSAVASNKKDGATSVLIARSLAELKPVIKKEDLVRLITSGLELRPLGTTVRTVGTATRDANCSAEDIARVVGSDQALSIRILKVANSSAYARGHNVGSLKEAIQRIGIQEIGRLAMTLGVFEEFEGCAAQYVDPRMFWEHSLACGIAACEIARVRGVERADDYFLWGMLHDVGRLVLLEHAAPQYAQVWSAAEQLNLPLEMIESRLMLVDHCDILERALEHWEFPREFITPVVQHHASVSKLKRMGPVQGQASATVALANRIVHALLIGSSGNDVVYPFDDLIEHLNLTPGQFAEVVRVVPTKTRDLKLSMLARSNEAAWPDFASQIKLNLTPGLVPICISTAPECDAYRVLFEQLGSWDDNRPNLAVVHLRNADELAPLRERLIAEETACGVAALPVLIILDRGSLADEILPSQERNLTVLRTPIRVPYLVESLNRLLSPKSP